VPFFDAEPLSETAREAAARRVRERQIALLEEREYSYGDEKRRRSTKSRDGRSPLLGTLFSRIAR
jgi:hypothetical protein